METMRRKKDFLYCEAIIKKHSKSFYYAFSKLPTEKANAIYAVYAFCRIADDYADDDTPLAEKINNLQQLRSELDLFSEGKEIDHPLWNALRHVFDQYDMDIQPFYDQLTGQQMDVDFIVPKTMQELERYCYYVAGSVGLMLLPIIASESKEKLKQAAIDLGVAMQITNILRDVGEDFYERRRVYLPETELKHFRYTLDDLSAGVINQSFVQLWENCAERAELLYDCFYEQIDLFDSDSRGPVSLSALVYRGILSAVRDNGYNCLSKRNYVDKDQMSQINAAMGSCS